MLEQYYAAQAAYQWQQIVRVLHWAAVACVVVAVVTFAVVAIRSRFK